MRVNTNKDKNHSKAEIGLPRKFMFSRKFMQDI